MQVKRAIKNASAETVSIFKICIEKKGAFKEFQNTYNLGLNPGWLTVWFY